MVQSIEQTYEGMFLVNAATASENWDGVMAAIDRIMERARAEIRSISKWDERRLSYPVSGQKRGTYILCYFRCPPDAIGTIERDAQLNEMILRVMILRADRIPQEIQEAPTPYVLGQQQKQAAKVVGETGTGESESAGQEGYPADTSDVAGRVDFTEAAEEVEVEDIPDILETFDHEEPKPVPEKKPPVDDIE